MTDDDEKRESFRLENPPPRRPRATFQPATGRQQVLFSGLKCLAGQTNLFTTDGPPERDPCPPNPS